MRDLVRWVGKSENGFVFLAAIVFGFAAVFGAIIGTIVMIDRGYPLIALGLWLGLPAWFIVAEYRRAKGGKE